ncbi:MAG TPA: sigma-70 family RNA polymerase sigma factor [Actinomycetota bacterium]|jgi:RNA polymerase sigma-70 factor (ECF subfamily)
MVTHELLAACRRGDPEAYEEVVRRTYRHVYTQALRLVGDRQDAEDVAQDAYLRVYRGLAGFRGDAQFETWLYRIVSNAAMSHLRKRRRFGELAKDSPEESRELPSATLVAEEAVDRDSLTKALDSLPPSLRVVVILKDVYGLSCREIGDQIGASEGAVKVRLHRARRRLKEMLFGAEARDEV